MCVNLCAFLVSGLWLMCVDSPSSASSDQSPSLRDLIVQAGQTATISNIELKDQY